MRRAIFSTNTQAAAGLIFPVSRAGKDQTKSSGTTSASLDGSFSYDLDGTITTYLWTQISGPAATITTPNSVTTTVTSLSDGNIYVFRLTVTDNDTQQHSDDVSITVDTFLAAILEIDTTVPSSIGTGVLSFTGGQPYEIITLLFELSSTISGDSLDFSGAQIGVLDHEHPTRTGSVALNSSGVLNKNYDGDGTPVFNCLVTITARSSVESIPAANTTYLTFNFTA